MMEKQIANAYPTPIGRFRVPDAGPTNAGLRRIILEREQREPSDNKANVGGWHSAGNLLEWPEPEIASVRAWIAEAVGAMIAATTGGQAPGGQLQATAWANVSRAGNYHRIHNHPMSAWSGVYYVDAGHDRPDQPLSGVLELCDPRPFTEMVATPGSPFGQRAIFKPETGMLVVFPSWLYHFVNPYGGAGERISVAFNVPWVPANSR